MSADECEAPQPIEARWPGVLASLGPSPDDDIA